MTRPIEGLDVSSDGKLRELPRWCAWQVLASIAMGVASVVLIAADDLHFSGWRWSIVVASAILVWGFAAPAHVIALNSLRRREFSVTLLGSVGALATWVLAAVDQVRHTNSSATLWAAIISALLLIVANSVRRVSGEGPTGRQGITPAVLAGAVASGIAWTVASDTRDGVTTALSVLIAVGPASLIIAAPGALELARHRARRKGIYLGDLASLECVKRIDMVVLSKGGTVTSGDLEVKSVSPLELKYDRELRWFAGALSHAFDDHVSRAISRLSARGQLARLKEEPGKGVAGAVDRHVVRIGEPSWMGHGAADDVWHTVAVDVDARPLGTITLADVIRDDAANGVDDIRSLGLNPVLVSSDTEARTRHIAEKVGIASWLSEVGPSGLADVVKRHQHEGRVVAAVSAEAVEADLPISLGGGPVGIGLVDLDVSRIAPAVRAARSAHRAAARASMVAAGVGVLAAIAAGAGLLGLAGATAAALTGLLVTLACSMSR